MKEKVQEILAHYPAAGHDSLIPILQQIQEKMGFLSEEAVVEVGKHLKMPASKIFGVATFTTSFVLPNPANTTFRCAAALLATCWDRPLCSTKWRSS